ncbi:C2H2-LIKE ZINC FINGER PROTEIN [Salix viminalis]|uniref:C2H2-LIKE ZINC FINGER PROTEIN n=1 Tax=Salix viminalis TaxID=40686 RepID=A0A6N2JXY5_SALVM|nr:C2H2-LIKE ZINC FINGER PROTEIN [Salix viminalis]
MAGGWIKSLQCKSRAFDDVFNPNPKHLLPSSSCRKTSSKTIKDVIIETKTKRSKSKHYPFNHNQQNPTTNPASTPPSRSRSTRNSDPVFPALTELPVGHPSRNVVDIIFHTSWSNKSFPGRIEMIFKVQNGSRTVSRFEEYRETVKTRAELTGGTTREENARCIADGNEMMRFYCLGPAGGVHEARGDAWVFPGGKGAKVCTFSGSGGAHESAGGGTGRRAMLVCRVVAGRVTKQTRFDSLIDDCRVGFDSVSGDNGELMAFDSRAVLPCFLIIYKL